MAWDEWEQLKANAADQRSTGMQLNQLDPGGGDLRLYRDKRATSRWVTAIW